MITNNTDFLQKIIMAMARESYERELMLGGIDDSFDEKDWCVDYIATHINALKLELLNLGDSVMMTPHNQTAIRLYSLDIGQEFMYNNFIKIVRVPGGWMYSNAGEENKVDRFIPYSDEFNPARGVISKTLASYMDTHADVLEMDA